MSHIPTLTSLKLICKLGSIFGGHPYNWSREKNKLYLENRKSRRYRWYLAVSVMCFNTIFVSIRGIQAYCCLHVSYGKQLVTLYASLASIVVTVCNFCNIKHKDDIVFTLNQIFKYNEKVYKLNKGFPEYKGGIYYKPTSPYLFYFLFGYGFLQFFSAIFNVTTPKYVHSLFNLKKTPKWKLIPIGLLDMCMIVSGSAAQCFTIVLFLTYVLSTKDSLKFLRKRKLPANEFLNMYRALELIRVSYSGCARQLVNTLLFATPMMVTIISACVIIKLHDEMHPATVCAFGFGLITIGFIVKSCYHNSYRLTELSTELLAYYEANQKNKTYYYRILRGMRPIKMYVGNFVVVHQNTTFIFLDYAINNTISLLVMT